MESFWDRVHPGTFLQDAVEGYDKPVRQRYREILARLPVTTMLEVGSGSGVDCRGALTVRPGIRYTGLDLTADMVAFCRLAYPEGQFLQGDIHHLPMADATYDLVYCKDVLNHLVDWGAGWSELWRVTRRYVLVNFFYGLTQHDAVFTRDGYIEHYITWNDALSQFESRSPASITIYPVRCEPNGRETLVLIEKDPSKRAQGLSAG